jgi:hypothetical protein
MAPEAVEWAGGDLVSAAYKFFTSNLQEWVEGLPEGQEAEYFDALRDTISATGLFVEFSRLFGETKVETKVVKTFIDQFVADAGTYRRFDRLDADSRERLFFSRREVLDVGVIFPVALRLWRAMNAAQISAV